jgi:hypothetical protein
MPIYQDPGSAAQNVAAEYVEVSGGQNNSNLVQAVDHIKFDTVNRQVGASITPDTLTAYASTNGVNSLGRFLLQPGLLYELEGDIGDVIGGAVGNYITYDWANADTGAILTAGSGGSNIVGASLSNSNQGRTLAKATFLPTVATRVELRIRQVSGVAGYGGQFSGNRATARIRVLSGQALVSATAGAAAGDIKFSGLTTDHSGNWILLDGRLKSTLTPAQQTVATSLGYGTNIPDMRGRMAVGAGGTLGAALNAIGGSLSIAQNALPNVTLPISGSAGLGGSGIWWYNGTTGNARMPNGGGVFDAQSTTSLTVSGNTASINGGVAQQNFISPYFANNWFVWLGSSVSTVTVASPMVGANGTIAGSGGTVPNTAATDNTKFLRGDGAWAAVALATAENTAIGTQTLGSAAWVVVTGGSIAIPSTGIWRVEYALSWSNPAANTMHTRITNAAGSHQPRSAASSYGLNCTNRSSFIATYNAGDVIKLEWTHTTGTSTLINNAAGTANTGGETYIQLIKLN